MTVEEYLEHCESDDGYCTHCGAIRYGMTEPDAEDYPCEECETNSVVGFETAALCGYVEIEE